MPNSNVSTLSLFSSFSTLDGPMESMESEMLSPMRGGKHELKLLSDEKLLSVPGLLARKSCEFSHHSPACIQKAAYNLSKIEERLQEWCHHVANQPVYVPMVTEGKQSNNSNHSNTKSNAKSNSAGKRSKKGKLDLRRYELKLENIDSGSSLKIAGYHEPDSSPTTCEKHSADTDDDVRDAENNNIPENNLEMIRGVMNLLTRVESDRSRTVKLLEKETDRTAQLKALVDANAYKRIHDYPKRVQEEHDKCICDIKELKWHYEYQSRHEENLNAQLKQAEGVCEALNADIEFARVNGPLIEEKLRLEGKAMEVIKEKQVEMDGDLKIAIGEMNKIKAEFGKVKQRSETEQRTMAQKIAGLSAELKSNLDQFLAAQNNFAKMKEDIMNLREKIKEDGANMVSHERHIENLYEIGEFLNEKLDNNRTSINEQIEIWEGLTKSDEEIQGEIDVLNGELNQMRKKLNTMLSGKTKELRKMIMLNKKTTKEIQACKKEIEETEKKRISNTKAAQRALVELQTVQDDLQLIKEQALDLKHMQVQLQLKLEQENVKSVEEEQKLNEQVHSLQKEKKEATHSRKTLLARIKAETASFEHRKRESENKKQRMYKTDEDLQKVIIDIKTQLETLSVKFDERCSDIVGLDKLLAQVAEKNRNFDETASAELKSLQRREDELNEEIREVASRQSHMNDTTEKWNKKLIDMESSTQMMTKFLSANTTSIEELEEEIAELQLQVEAAIRLEDSLKASLSEVQNRSMNQQTKHDNLMSGRRYTLDNISKLLTDSLTENDRLAAKYINIQSDHINTKNDFINAYEKSTIAQEGLRDKETLCELHTRLHDALKCYYQLRGIQTKAGLSNFENMTRNTYSRLREIQVQLERCINNVSVFLKATSKSLEGGASVRNLALDMMENRLSVMRENVMV